MIDLYLKAATQEDMNAALVAAELAHESAKHGLLPASGVSLDVIGPITKWDSSVEPPVATVYPEWHVNVRCGALTEDQHSAILDYVITPPKTPYRVWA
jgi:hypothetical protein